MFIMAEVLDWAVDTFGPTARDRKERARRFVEEAVELAQAEGVNVDVLDRIVQRVYSRAPGGTAKEIGQARLTLDLLAYNAGFNSMVEASAEWHRISSLPKEHHQKRHAAKVELGI